MSTSQFYKTFITSLLEGTVTYYIAYHSNTVLCNCNVYGSNYADLALELVITQLSDYQYRIRIYRARRSKEEKLEVNMYDFG